jgi:hypothetical protein
MMRPDSTVVVLGPRGSGKTVFMTDLLYCMRDKLDLTVVFCPTRDTREQYEQFIPKCHVYPVYSKTRLSSIYETQKKLSAQMSGETRGGGPTMGGTLRNMGIVLDDCMFDKEEVRGKAIRAIMMNGRHEKVFFVNAVQYVVDFPRDLRSQVDVIVVFPLSGLFLKGAYDHMLSGAFDSFEECQVTFASLKEHECLIFDAKAKQKKQPYLFFYKARIDLPRFRVGSNWLWEKYYRYMVRPENTARQLREEIAMTLAIAKGKIAAPESKPKGGGAAAGAAAAVPHQGITVRRYPGPMDGTEATVDLVTGPAAAATLPSADKPKKPKKLLRKPAQLLQGVSLI